MRCKNVFFVLQEGVTRIGPQGDSLEEQHIGTVSHIHLNILIKSCVAIHSDKVESTDLLCFSTLQSCQKDAHVRLRIVVGW